MRIMRPGRGVVVGGFTLVEIMIVVAIIALLASIAIPNLLRARVAANDSAAKSALRAYSTASEAFMGSNNGNYPGAVTSLTGAVPAYINVDYCGDMHEGFNYLCTFSAGGYVITATPSVIGSSGTTTFSITTGGVLTP